MDNKKHNLKFFSEIDEYLEMMKHEPKQELSTLSVRITSVEKEALSFVAEQIYQMKLSDLVRIILDSYLDGAKQSLIKSNPDLLLELFKVSYKAQGYEDDVLDELAKRQLEHFKSRFSLS